MANPAAMAAVSLIGAYPTCRADDVSAVVSDMPPLSGNENVDVLDWAVRGSTGDRSARSPIISGRNQPAMRALGLFAERRT